jgi:predicted ATP-grasp superfamily ATP-dependent carboligase
MHRRGLPAPAVLRTGSRPGRTGDWLVKPLASGGGHRIRTWRPGMHLPSGSYLQERIDGVPGSIVFVAAGGRAVPLGVSRQVIGDAAFGSAGYRYCGSILADAGDPVWGAGSTLAARALILAQTIAAAFDLAGVNGIDLIVRDGVPLPIEVNPRWCSPVELVERAYGLCAFAAHARACTSGDLSGVDLARAPASASGKAVVFARHGATVGDTRTWCADPTVADVPRPGTRVHAGQPVCTVFATGDSSEACYAALVARAEGIYTEMSAWTR